MPHDSIPGASLYGVGLSLTARANMPSSGIGSDITLQEAVDLLHRLTTEFMKVVASWCLAGAPGIGFWQGEDCETG
jgi:hypothetical protein